MAQLRLAGFTAVRVTSNWLPGLTAPTAHELTVLRNVEAAARLSGVKVYVSVYHPGSRTTPLELSDQTDFARYAAALATGDPDVRRHHRGERAEPEPLLAPAVRPQRRQRLRARLPPAARPELRRAQGGRPDAPRLGRRARATRLRPSRRDPADLLPHRLHPGDGRRLPRERPHRARHGRLRDAPVPGQLVDEPGHREPAQHLDRARGLRQARGAPRAGPSTARPRPAPPCRSSTTSSGSSRSSPTASGRSTRGRSRRRRSPSTSRSRPRPTTSG